MTMRPWTGLGLSLVATCSLGLGCGPESASEGGEDMWEDGRTLTDAYLPDQTRRIDLIVVIDDSPSMRGHLPTMAANIPAFAELFINDETPDIRVALTTTSVPGPTCAGDRAGGGGPTLTSCRAHLDDFIGPDEHGEHGGGELDLAALCEDLCSLDSLEVVPSPGSRPGGSLAPRPWLDSPQGEIGSNLAEGVDYVEAFSCAAMQGFAGCEFESPIEAAARMVERFADPQDTMFGFRRPDASLMILIISDEDDCSHPDSSGVIFSPEGERVFWPDGADEPLSAICANASLACGDPGEPCELVDHALDGSPTTDPEAAVLRPIDRLLAAFEAADEYRHGRYEPVVSVLGGFTETGQLNTKQVDPASPHAAYAEAFGVGPACAGPNFDGETVRAVPGTRLAALTEAVTPGNNYSICAWDWVSAFSWAAMNIPAQLRPWCMPGTDEWTCVEGFADGEPDCVVEAVAGEFREDIPLCVRDGDTWAIDEATHDYLIPAGAHTCWVWADDEGETPSFADDISPECSEWEQRADIKVARRPEADAELPYDAYYVLRCRPC